MTPNKNADITGLGDGGYLVTWMSSNQDGDNWGVFGQRFNTEGVAVGNEFQINTTTGNKQWRPEASGLADGGFVVVWNSQDQDGSDIGVFGQRFNARW